MAKHRWLFALLVVCILAQQTAAQQAPVPTPGVIRINVNLVQVDAVVTDSKGKPVTNLTAEDFEVLQDGKAQKIRNFEFVRVTNALENMALPSVLPRPRDPKVPAPTPPPVSNLKPEQVRRTIALVVDDIALSFDGTVHVREALRKWVDTEMQQDDLVSIVRTNAAMGALQQFTNDKRLLYTAIDLLRFQPGRVGAGGFAAFTPAPMMVDDAEGNAVPVTGPDTTVFDMELQSAYLTGSYNAISYVIQGLRELPGRKSLILFSEDLSLPSIDSTGQQRRSIEDRLRLLADEANRSSVVIYAIDPRGSAYTGPTASDNLTGRSETEIASMINGRAAQYIASQDGMALLTQRTGGLFFSGNNDLVSPLRKAVDDGNGYYLMGYTPDESTFETKMDLLKYHSIKVKVKRPGLTVRSRTGFFGLSDARPDAPKTPQAQIAKALVSPFTTADVHVRLTTLFQHSEAEGSSLKTLLYFDARDLTFSETPDGAHTATVDIAIVTFNENGDPSQAVNKTIALRIPKEDYEAVLRQGLIHTASVPIKKAGPYQLRVAVRDATSSKLGSAMQFVDVPNVKNGRMVVSGIAVARNPVLPGAAEGTPAVRIFKTGEAISYVYEILNARTDSNDKTQLETMMRLYREGEIVYEGPPSALNLVNERDARRVAVTSQLQLTKVTPGNYAMQVIVFDRLRKDRVASQAIDFEVRQ